MIGLAAIIICVIIWVTKEKEIDRLTLENKRLRAKLKQYELGQVNPVEKPKVVEPKVTVKPKEVVVVPQPKKVEISKEEILRREREKKNVTILVTGAICIVLAALVFLVSTWATIPNILKTIVLGLLTVVFFVGSNLAETKYKLPKASKVFYYIGMAYIPICLMSISIFQLFGEYLSIYGDGKYLFLTLSAILVSILYYKNRKDKYLFIGSILSQVLSIVFFSLILSENVVLIGINLLLYNILLMLLTKESMFKNTYNILPWLTLLIAIGNVGEVTISLVIMEALLAINYLMLYIKQSHIVYSYAFNFSILGIITFIAMLLENVLYDNTIYTLFLFFTVFSYALESVVLSYKRDAKLLESAAVVTFVALVIFHIINAINGTIPTYIIALSILAIIIHFYIKGEKKLSDLVEFILPTYFIITGIDVLVNLEATYHAYALFAFVTFLINELIKEKLPDLYTKSLIVSHINLATTLIVSSVINGITDNAIYVIALMAVYAYNYVSTKLGLFKYLAYVTSNFAIYSVITLFEYTIEPTYYVPMITTLVIMLIERKYKSLNDVVSNIYLIVSEIVAFAMLYNIRIVDNDILPEILTLVAGVGLFGMNLKKEKMPIQLTTLICLVPAIFDNNFDPIWANVIMLASVIAVTFVSIKTNAWSYYTIASGVYVIAALSAMEGIYLSKIILLAWAVAHLLFVDKEYQQDIFKGVTCFAALWLYNTVVHELELDEYTLFVMLGYIFTAIFTLRGIISRYIKDIKVFEYLTYGVIYFIALSMYANELDGILFVSFLIFLIIASYIKKYGELFIITSAAVLLNIFMLTREFWFSIPWWLYLLGAGVVLITFAINNEANEKGKGNKPIDFLIKKLQEKINEEE